MAEIEFSVMYHSPHATQQLRELLSEFEQQTKIHVRLKTLNWADAWTDLIRVALYNDGPDVSEIGNTWVSDLARMNALRPFAPPDLRNLGGPQAFLASLWQTVSVIGKPQIWAIPWLADTRILYYRQDLLSEAGIDPATAFADHLALENTLQRLQEAGIEAPWVVPSGQTRMTIHHVASWVWGADGHFLSEDGRQALIGEPAALQGMQQYFSLARYLAPIARHLDDTQSDSLYWIGKAAVTLSGPWLLREQAIPEEVLANSAFVAPPGVPFVGGSHLVLWRHSSKTRAALQLIKFLNSPEVQIRYSQEIGLFPTSLEALADQRITNNAQTRALVDRIQNGRSFRSVPLWGMLESRISDSFSNLWREILQSDPQASDRLVTEYMVPLSRRLSRNLQQDLA